MGAQDLRGPMQLRKHKTHVLTTVPSCASANIADIDRGVPDDTDE